MPGNADLTRKQHVALQHAAAREARLGTNDIVFANHTRVADLHQAVDLCASLHACLAHGRPVDRSEALDLHVIFDDRHAGLYDFFVRAVGALRKSEAVSANHDAIAARVTRFPTRQNSRTAA